MWILKILLHQKAVKIWKYKPLENQSWCKDEELSLEMFNNYLKVTQWVSVSQYLKPVPVTTNIK